jgi:hypothetical protein
MFTGILLLIAVQFLFLKYHKNHALCWLNFLSAKTTKEAKIIGCIGVKADPNMVSIYSKKSPVFLSKIDSFFQRSYWLIVQL